MDLFCHYSSYLDQYRPHAWCQSSTTQTKTHDALQTKKKDPDFNATLIFRISENTRAQGLVFLQGQAINVWLKAELCNSSSELMQSCLIWIPIFVTQKKKKKGYKNENKTFILASQPEEDIP